MFKNGEVAYTRWARSADSKFGHFWFEEFATKNFECDFGFMEEAKKDSTSRSSGVMSKPAENI